MIAINNFDELISFLKKHPVTSEQAAIIIETTMQVYIAPESDKTDLIASLKEYWQEHSTKLERPLFLEDTE